MDYEKAKQENLIKYITKIIRNPELKVIVEAVPVSLNDKELGFIFYLTNSKGEVELKGEVKLDDVLKYGKIIDKNTKQTKKIKLELNLKKIKQKFESETGLKVENFGFKYKDKDLGESHIS